MEIFEEHNVIDIAMHLNYVGPPQAGAIATFSGTRRHIFDGKTVMELRYEAHVPMVDHRLFFLPSILEYQLSFFLPCSWRTKGLIRRTT